MTTTTETRKRRPLCLSCGGSRICFDATAEWNAERGRFELLAAFDELECQDCEHKTPLQWLEDGQTVAHLIAEEHSRELSRLEDSNPFRDEDAAWVRYRETVNRLDGRAGNFARERTSRGDRVETFHFRDGSTLTIDVSDPSCAQFRAE